MRRVRRGGAAWRRVLTGVLAVLALEAASAVPARAGGILEARILAVQRRDTPDLEPDGRVQYVAVQIERTVDGQERSGEVVVRVWLNGAGPGVRAWGRGKNGIYVMDPAYWRRGSKVSIAPWNACDFASFPDIKDSAARARARFGDEEFEAWASSPLLCVSFDHFFLLDGDGFVIDPDNSDKPEPRIDVDRGED